MKRMLWLVILLLGAHSVHAETGRSEAIQRAREQYVKGKAALEKHNWQDAIDAFSTVIALVEQPSDLLDSHYHRAVALYKLQRCAEAISDLSRFLEIAEPESYHRQIVTAEVMIRSCMDSVQTQELPSGIVRKDGRIIRQKDGMEMVVIPSGSFIMGSETGPENERPIRNIRISRSFLIDQHEVTEGTYRSITGNVPRLHYRGDGRDPALSPSRRQPNVPSLADVLESDRRPCDYCALQRPTWDQALAYCRAVGARLPSEAEWEYAGRGGLSKAEFPWGNDEPCGFRKCYSNTRHNDDGFPEAAPPCSFPINGFGLCDMGGNLKEWVWDWYAPYSAVDTVDPTGPSEGSEHVIRGGSYSWGEPRVARREGAAHGVPPMAVGFRCAMDLN